MHVLTVVLQGNNKNQNAMVSAIAAANKNTIVVASVPGAILMPWSTEVSSILTNFMPGQQAGNAIADILFGSVNPSARFFFRALPCVAVLYVYVAVCFRRLPITMPNKDNETNFSPEQWPGLPNPSDPVYAVYSEKLLVGYRYYDAHNISFTSVILTSSSSSPLSVFSTFVVALLLCVRVFLSAMASPIPPLHTLVGARLSGNPGKR